MHLSFLAQTSVSLIIYLKIYIIFTYVIMLNIIFAIYLKSVIEFSHLISLKAWLGSE